MGGGEFNLITIEVGGSYGNHPQLPSHNIIEDLNQNLKKFKVKPKVNIIQGLSLDPSILIKCEHLLNKQKFDMIFMDSDGLIEQNIEVFKRFFQKEVYLVIDDYRSIGTNDPFNKSETTINWITTNLKNKKLKQLATLEWATWFGIYRK